MAWYELDIAVLNLRRMPAELVRRAKVAAAERRITLKQLVIDALSRELGTRFVHRRSPADEPDPASVFDDPPPSGENSPQSE